MNNDLPNDKTEDLLRKHLEGFSEDPPASLWNNIEGHLPPSRRTWRRWLPWLTALLTLGLVVQFWYFEHRLNELYRQIPAPPQTPAQSPAQPPAPPAALPTDVPVAVQPAPAESVAPNRPDAANEAGRNDEGRSVASGDFQAAPEVRNPSAPAIRQEHPARPDATPLPDRPQLSSLPPNAGQPLPADTVNTPTSDPLPAAGSMAALEPLRQIPAGSVRTARPAPPVLFINPVDALVPPTPRYSIEVTAMPLQIQSTADVHTGRIPGGHRPRQHVQNDRPSSATGWRAGALATYALNRNWGLVAGAFLRQATVESSHRPRLEFQDGHHPSGPHHPPHHPQGQDQDYEFDYTIYGAGSESGVTVRVSSDDSIPFQPGPSHPVRFTVNTTQKTRRLEIPFGLQYQSTLGRWQPTLRAGGMVSRRLLQVASIRDVAVETPGFYVRHDQKPEIRPQQSSPLSLSAWASGGVEYKLTPFLAVTTALWYTWSQEATGPAKAVTMRESTLGLSAGLAYRF
jgi:hypothetical protein